MTVAFDISRYPIFRDGDLFYPGVASILSIVQCGGQALIFSSKGDIAPHEKKLIAKLTQSFGGKIRLVANADQADMCVN